MMQEVVRDILHQQLNCSAVLQSCADIASSFTGKSCLVIPFGPTHAANSLVQALKVGTNLDVHLRKAPYADKECSIPHTGDHGSSMKGKLAIVGMADWL